MLGDIIRPPYTTSLLQEEYSVVPKDGNHVPCEIVSGSSSTQVLSHVTEQKNFKQNVAEQHQQSILEEMKRKSTYPLKQA